MEAKQRRFACCLTCNRSDLVFLQGLGGGIPVEGMWISGNGESHTGHQIEELPSPQEAPVEDAPLDLDQSHPTNHGHRILLSSWEARAWTIHRLGRAGSKL